MKAWSLALLWLPRVVLASDAVEVRLEAKALTGEGRPALVIVAHQKIKQAELELSRVGGNRFRRKVGPLGAGVLHRIFLPVEEPGQARFTGYLNVELDDAPPGKIPLDFKVEVLEALTVSISPDDVSLEHRTIRIEVSRPLVKAELTLTYSEGARVSYTSKLVRKEGFYVASWPKSQGELLKIGVQVYDKDNYFTGVDLFPWRIEIPHDDVAFQSGRFHIREEELPKLEASFLELKASIDKYGRWIDGVRLFVVGHTDTVGRHESNQALSTHRARAIAAWFRQRGLTVPIAFAGFGETLLLIPTEDETDEARNRRVQYIVAIEPPSFEVPVRWKAL